MTGYAYASVWPRMLKLCNRSPLQHADFSSHPSQVSLWQAELSYSRLLLTCLATDM